MARPKTRENCSDAIRLRGVRQNNLKDVDCDIPLGKLTVITGVSGSGKSSLAFDTLYAEGQRRYIETFSAYTRQFLDRMERPDADSIEGIPPAVAIDQSGQVRTSRSTVGTLTGINDYLKLLFARCSVGHCPSCEEPIEPEDTSAVMRALGELKPGDFPVLVIAAVDLGGVEDSGIVIQVLRSQGYVRFRRTDGSVARLDALEDADCTGGRIGVVIDRLSPSSSRQRRADSIAQAFRTGHGALQLEGASLSQAFHEGLRCAKCSVDLPRVTPGLFTFNSAYGACPGCRGFGRVIEIDWNRVVPDERLSIRRGAIKPWQSPKRSGRRRLCVAACEKEGISIEAPWSELDENERHFVLEGGKGWDGVRGFFRKLEKKKYRMHVRVLLSRYRGYFTCPDCKGGRLRPEALCFRVGGATLPEFWKLPVREAIPLVEALLAKSIQRPVKLLVEEVASRLRYLDSVGLGYLSLDRQSRTLSGGEVERVNLTAALGASLVDTLFILDEPSVGLHSRDNDRLMKILEQIRDRGNTVVVVEHDLELLSQADHLIDMGPGSGKRGGQIVASGTVAEVAANPSSLTGKYISGRLHCGRPDAHGETRDIMSTRGLEIRGARENNLRGIDLDVPVDSFVVVSGVSGSGKSSLVHDVIWRSYEKSQGRALEGDVRVDSVTGWEHCDEVVMVDQSPIGKTPRGNPATYTKLFDSIRKMFAETDDARRAKFTASHFSFNVEGGRCPDCQGAGAVQIEMQFLSDVTLACETCDGKRFREEVLRVKLRGLNVHEVLALTIDEAREFFADDSRLVKKLEFLSDVGLGYLHLGQPINTLSGGEAQRLKLAGRVLAAKSGGRLLFLLDEPTTGLHLEDVSRLIEVLDRLTARGHGVIVIEHHLDVIAAADFVIDLGPEGGDQGGGVVAQGRPEDLMACPDSITGIWLERNLQARERAGAKRVQFTSSRSMTNGATVGAGGAGGAGGTGLNPAKKAAKRAANVISVIGARENNLRDITVHIPRNQFVVVTGLSGSGKSSLVYDIVFSEGQRRYLDCLSAYARQFVEDLHRPDIDHLEGIPPAVAIEQRTTIGGRKSTVGTVTELYHFSRLLFTRAGVQFCPDCEIEVRPRSFDDIRSALRRMSAAGHCTLLAPVVRGKKGFHSRVFSAARKRGFERARVDGSWFDIPETEVKLTRNVAHEIDLVIASGEDLAARLDEVLRSGLELGAGVVRCVDSRGEETLFSRQRSCPRCSRDFDEPDPRNFSFNSRHGWCESCSGYGTHLELDPELLIEEWHLSIDTPKVLAVLDDQPFTRGARRKFLREIEQVTGLPSDGRALADWGRKSLDTLFRGRPRQGFAGLLAYVSSRLADLEDDDREYYLARWGMEKPCPVCDGGRLARDWAAVRVGGLTLPAMARANIRELRSRFRDLQFEKKLAPVVRPILAEIDSRLAFLDRVGLHYMTLDRSVATLSGGEAQRIRLASQLGSQLRGVCYILDEPTIGLHPRDNERLIATLRDLRDHGNSVIVIEHDDATIEAADHIIDMGPGPGKHGGEVVVQGTLHDITAHKISSTGEYFRERENRTFELASDTLDARPALEVHGATLHNLKGIDAKFPLGAVTVVTGVSGAGKSTLVRDVLEESVHRQFRCLRGQVPGVERVKGVDLLEGVREVDQAPIGRTPRSTPATYVGFWKRIRQIFAAVPEARIRGYDARRFSFNTGDGRCETCRGQGRIRMEMDFLPDVTIDCEVCGGDRFNPQTLEIEYSGKNVAEILALSVEEALEFFANFTELTRPLRALDSLGLGYLTLGQASTTLSGGEAQRVKLAVELAKRAIGAWLYLFDEPTTGLHMKDVEKLVSVFRRLAEGGHAVVVIEHHQEIVAGADWLIDLGPEGGEQGGELLYQGPTAGLLDAPSDSATAHSLREFVKAERPGPRSKRAKKKPASKKPAKK